MIKIILSLVILFISVSTMNAQDENCFSIEIGIGGGDGFSYSTTRTINYSRKIFDKAYLKVGYSQSNQTEKLSDLVLNPDLKEEFLQSVFTGTNNTSENPDVGYTQFYSYNLGLQYAFRTTDDAKLSLAGGLRYYVFDQMDYVSRSGSSLDGFREGIDHEESIAYDFGIYYHQKLSDVLGLHASFDYFSGVGFFSGNLGVDVYF